MDAEALRCWLALIRVRGLGPVAGARLLERFGTPEAILSAGARAWRADGVDAATCDALATPDWAGVDADLRWLETPGALFIPRNDHRYPPLLADIADAPLGLYGIGDAECLAWPQLAIVGARQASAQGLEHAQDFAAELARRGLVVTSGLALGIDGAAHRGALDAGGYTLAVCGNGLDRVYPARHRELARRIVGHGLLLSEFPPATPPLPEHFPRRNRLISALALGVLVVEAARESGSLITARFAAEQGREVFAIPGSIHNPMTRGCHALIREGARLVETVDDILEEIAPQLAQARSADSARAAQAADEPDCPVLAALGADPARFDQLLARTGLTAAALNARLSELELGGQIATGPGDTYMRLKHR